MAEYKIRALDILGQAIQEAQQLEDDPYKIKVFQESDKTTALVYIALELVEVDPGLAIQVAEKAGEQGHWANKSLVLSRAVPELAKTDPERALTVADQISDYRKCSRLHAIVDDLAKADRQGALPLIEKVLEIARRSGCYGVLLHIAEQLVSTDPDRAKRMIDEALEIARLSKYEWVLEAGVIAGTLVSILDRLLRVAERFIGTAPDYAKQIFMQALGFIRYFEHRQHIEAELSMVLPKLARVDLDGALASVEPCLSWLSEENEYLNFNDFEPSPDAAEMTASKWRLIGDIAAELAEEETEQALKVAGKIEDQGIYCGALVSIAKELAGTDPQRAKQIFDLAVRTAEQLDDRQSVSSCLADIARGLAQIDPQRARQIFDLAVHAAEQISDSWKRSFQLENFVCYFRQVVDPERALKLAQGIDEARWRCRALCVAAMALPQADENLLMQLSGEVASLMQQFSITSSEFIMGAGLADLLKRLAQLNIDRALETAERMEEPLRGEMLGHLALVVAERDPERAFLMAEKSILPGHLQLGSIAVELAKADLDRALKIVAKIEPTYSANSRKVNALKKIASETAKIDLNRALLIANEIERGPERCRALAAIAGTLLALTNE